MDKVIISAKNIWKKYTFGQIVPYFTLVDSIQGFVKDPFSLIQNKLKKVTLEENEFWALQNINFQVKKGEVLGIIGRNGSGKSTLLKILSRITPPTRGEIRLCGRVSSLLEVGTGFQQELTGRENIFLNGAILGMKQKEIKKQFDEIVEFAEVSKFLDTPVKHYSSGMYVRLAFSVAAHLNPEILIVDEVLAVGDVAFQKKCLGKMENVSQSGRTVLFVSHNLQAVKNLCRRTILIDEGKVISDEPTEVSLNRYNNLLRETKIGGKTNVNIQKQRRGSGAIRFTEVELQDVKGKKKLNFNMGETIRFKMAYKVYKELKGIVVYIAICTDGTRTIVTTVRHKVTTQIVKKGTSGKITIELPDAYIRPGEYPLFIQVGEIGFKNENYDVLDDLTAPLIITSGTNSDNPDLIQTQLLGYFDIPSKIISNDINPDK